MLGFGSCDYLHIVELNLPIVVNILFHNYYSLVISISLCLIIVIPNETVKLLLKEKYRSLIYLLKYILNILRYGKCKQCNEKLVLVTQ